MPSNRKRRARQRILTAVPQWVKEYLENGTVPERGTPDFQQYVEWRHFDVDIPGLPSQKTGEVSE